LQQEFDIEIRDKGSENVVADHLSKLIVDFNEDVEPIAETFLDEQLMHISQIPTPWFADIMNPCYRPDTLTLDQARQIKILG
jgi:hypothetical protein